MLLAPFTRITLVLVVAAALPCLYAERPAAHPIRFRNAAPGSGLNFVMHNHPTKHKYLIETMAGGVAVFDYDGDGRPDIFCTNGAPIDRKSVV